jgi:hypothetical protein
MQGSGTFPWGSGPIVDTLEDIVFSGHVAALEPSSWWGRVLFTTRLEIVARAPRLHTVVRGTPVSGYRQNPFTTSACQWIMMKSNPFILASIYMNNI